MIAPTYHRSLLSPAEQDVYKDIVKGLLQRKESICIKQERAQRESIRKIVNAVHLDHPELFYVNFYQYKVKQSPLPWGTCLCFQMFLDEASSSAVMNTLNAKASALEKSAQKCSPQKTYFLIAKEIASTTKYMDSNSAFWDHTVAGPILRHKGVCESFAKLYLFFCQRLNIPCSIVIGTLNGELHAWNMIELRGSRKYIDITSAVQNNAEFSIFPSTFFKSEQQLRRSGYNW